MNHTIRFTTLYKQYRENVHIQLKKVYKLDIESDLIADIALYTKIENRGCRVMANDMLITDFTDKCICTSLGWSV